MIWTKDRWAGAREADGSCSSYAIVPGTVWQVYSVPLITVGWFHAL